MTRRGYNEVKTSNIKIYQKQEDSTNWPNNISDRLYEYYKDLSNEELPRQQEESLLEMI